MALNKVTYTNGATIIGADNLNEIQDAIIALEGQPSGGAVSEDLKQALLQLAQKVTYIDDQGQTYYQDLYDALYPPKTVVLITAVFEQGSTVIYDDTALNDLKQYLTVTAKYDDNTTSILPDSAYSLSGLLEAPSSTVTVLYNGVSTTFTVTVTARPTLSSITAVYTQSGTVYDTDTIDSLKADLVVTAHYSDSSTQTVPAADYTLSGTLAEGPSTITVSYGGKTATFDVTVTKYWDFEWTYADGLIENTEYWIKSSGSTGTTSMVSDGEKIVGGNPGYTQLYPNGAPFMYMTNGYGVMEFTVYGKWDVLPTVAVFTVNTGNSEKTRRICLKVLAGKWCLRDTNGTPIGDALTDTVYTVRIELKGTVGDIYINGTLVAGNVDTSTMTTGGANSVTVNEHQTYTVLQSMKIKSGGV